MNNTAEVITALQRSNPSHKASDAQISVSFASLRGYYLTDTWYPPLTGSTTIALPPSNHSDYEEIIEQLKRAIDGIYVQGTGGNAAIAATPAASGAFVYVSASPQIQHLWATHKPSVSLPEKLQTIRRYFSLATVELARVLEVRRQTIYDWIDGKYDPQVANYKKIESVYKMAEEWSNFAHMPVRRALHSPITSINGRSLYDELSSNPIREQRVRDAFGTLKEMLTQQPRASRTRQRLGEHGFRPAPASQRRRRIREESQTFTAEE